MNLAFFFLSLLQLFLMHIFIIFGHRQEKAKNTTTVARTPKKKELTLIVSTWKTKMPKKILFSVFEHSQPILIDQQKI